MGLTDQEKQNIQISQARKLLMFQQTEESQLLENSYMALKKMASLDRQKAMKTQATIQHCLYYSGKEDGIQACIEVVNQIIAEGEGIEKMRDQINLQEAG